MPRIAELKTIDGRLAVFLDMPDIDEGSVTILSESEQSALDATISSLRQEVETLKGEREGHDKPCYYCGEPCNSLAGNPGLWPVALCHKDEPGRVKWHHTGCVMRRLQEVEELREALGKTEAALDKMHRHSIEGALLGYTQPALWGDKLFASHHDAFEALKTARALLPKDKP